MAADFNKVDTEKLAAAAAEIGSVRKKITSSVDSVHAVFRKMLESNEGSAADELSAVTGQLRRSSSDILNALANYEKVLAELAGIYNDAEKQTVGTAGKLKFGGLR